MGERRAFGHPTSAFRTSAPCRPDPTGLRLHADSESTANALLRRRCDVARQATYSSGPLSTSTGGTRVESRGFPRGRRAGSNCRCCSFAAGTTTCRYISSDTAVAACWDAGSSQSVVRCTTPVGCRSLQRPIPKSSRLALVVSVAAAAAELELSAPSVSAAAASFTADRLRATISTPSGSDDSQHSIFVSAHTHLTTACCLRGTRCRYSRYDTPYCHPNSRCCASWRS